jgi:two-component system, OmpR family, KDP operon response regulator KdpE
LTRVLVVDDEPQIRRAMRTSLEAHGYEVRTVGTGEEAVVSAAEDDPELVLLDLGLPDLDGTEVIRRVRSFSEVPIIVLSVRDRQATRWRRSMPGPTITSPSRSASRRSSRVCARALRRSQVGEPSPPVVRLGEVEVDVGRRLITVRDAPIHLTRTEYALLEAFVTNPGKLLTHQWLLRRVWGPGYAQESHYLRVYVRSLRRKLGDEASAPRLILTEPGVVYRWIG